MTTAAQTCTLVADDGETIDCLQWPGDAPVRAVVQIAHGMGEHPGRYDWVAEQLVAAGFAVHANVHRGHGEREAARRRLGDFGPRGFAGLVSDMAVVSAHVRTQHAGAPLILLGHSMGSFAAQLYLLDHGAQLAGAALSGTAALDLLKAGRPPGWRLEDASGGLPTRTPFDWLSRDDAVVDRYVADPLCGFSTTADSRASMFAACERCSRVDELRRIPAELPLYLFTGDNDPVNDRLAWFHPLAARYREAGLRDVSAHVYGGARHEVLNETNRAEVMANLLAWIERVIA